MREIPLVNDQFYHIFNRGVDHRTIFIDDNDRQRFLRGLRILNDTERPVNVSFQKDFVISNPYVEVASYCLMTNHFHLLLRQIVDGGISTFLKRLLGSYVKYFNLRHERDGRLFTREFQNVAIESDRQLITTLRYIHLNPLDISGTQSPPESQRAFLEYYPWSSHRFYLGQASDPIINGNFVRSLIGADYQRLFHWQN